MKISELTGAQLDYWVARADESWKWAHRLFATMTLDPTFASVELCTYSNGMQECVLLPNNPMRQEPQVFTPSTEWAHGGLIIERWKINITTKSNPDMGGNDWIASFSGRHANRGYGPTPLVAAMRAKVASRYGDEVPDETAA